MANGETYMTTDELRFIGEALYPKGGWQRRLGRDIDRNAVSMSRKATGAAEVTQQEAHLLRAIYRMHKQRRDWRAELNKIKEEIAEQLRAGKLETEEVNIFG